MDPACAEPAWQYWAGMIAGSALIAAIVGPVVTALVEDHRVGAAEDRSAGANALAAAADLERYAMECAEAISDHKTAEEYDGDVGKFLRSVPQAPSLSINLGPLRPEKAAVLSRLAVFPQRIAREQREVEFWDDMLRDDDITRSEAKFATARAGIESIELAASLRYWFSLPERTLLFGDGKLSAYLHKVARVIYLL